MSSQPSCLELSQSISELLSLKNSTPQVAQSVGETCTIVRDSVGKRRKELQERIEILKTFVSFCTLCREVRQWVWLLSHGCIVFCIYHVVCVCVRVCVRVCMLDGYKYWKAPHPPSHLKLGIYN